MNIQIIGAGSWGLALARQLALNGHAVRLWARAEDRPDVIQRTRYSPLFLKHIEIPDTIVIDQDVNFDADIAVFAVPSHAMRSVVGRFEFSPDCIRLSVAKGIENDTLMRMSEVIADVSEAPLIAALSGPSHAEEVARDLPASVVVAGTDVEACVQCQTAFVGKSFRVYTSPDLVGVELGGALKNVIAIAAGVCDGIGLGDNAKAALMTRGLAEISRLGIALGADPLTFSGLSGMGDLITTCESTYSRNRAVGEKIAVGMSLAEITASTPMVAEGVRTAKSALALAARSGVEMPITQQVHRVLYEGSDAREAVGILMERDAKPERW